MRESQLELVTSALEQEWKVVHQTSSLAFNIIFQSWAPHFFHVMHPLYIFRPFLPRHRHNFSNGL